MTEYDHNKIVFTNNNRGFSLVELIICVAILAIAIIPLYQSMTLSTRTNAKAQSRQNATSLAESVMEEIKASSIEELEERYNGLSGVMDPKTGKYKPNIVLMTEDDTGFFKKGDGTEKSEKEIASSAKTAASATKSFLSGKVGTPKQPFYVLYEPERYAAQSNEKFEVIATLRTSTYMKAATDASNANSKKLPKIDEIDVLSQAVITTKELSKYDDAALDYFMEDGDHRVDTKAISKKRIIIEKNNLFADHVSVVCHVIYEEKDSTPVNTFQREVYSGTFGPPSPTDPLSSNIYLFYKRTQPDEEIIIHDNTNRGTHKVFLIVQDESEAPTTRVIDHTTVKVDSKIPPSSTTKDLMTLTLNSELDDDGCMIVYKTDEYGDIVEDADGNPIKEYELITNMTSDGSAENGHIYNEEAAIRIYDVNVILVRKGEVYASLSSTKEARDNIK